MGSKLEVLRFDFAENDRARTEGITTGRIKVMVVKGRPVGAGIVGAQAGELIGLWALAISAKLKISDIAGMVAPYPTLTEVSKRAAGQYYVPRLFENPTIKKIVRLVQKFADSRLPSLFVKRAVPRSGCAYVIRLRHVSSIPFRAGFWA